MQRCVDASLRLTVGHCALQVTQIDAGAERHTLSFDVIAETLRATNLGRLREGSTVNFERRGPRSPPSASSARARTGFSIVVRLRTVACH